MSAQFPAHLFQADIDIVDILALLNPVPDASHTRNRKLSPPDSRCFPGTRKKVLKEIHSWIDSTLLLNRLHVMWIFGYAGCGKSAIAQAICDHYAGQGRLVGAFFFFRGAGGRSNISQFATTIASQVAAAIPATAPLIEAAIRANPGLLSTTTTSLSDQFDQLVYQPIYKAVGLAAILIHGPYIIVLDGVDECADHDDVADYVERMLAFFRQKPFIPLRFIITSRVENHIHNLLHSSKQVKLLNLVQHTSDADILTALEAGIAMKRHGLGLACDGAWPSEEDKAKLVKHIGGSFIFLDTIVKLLFDVNIYRGLTPMERLPLLLQMQPNFDELYRAILELAKDLPHFHKIISTIALAHEPLSIAQIADLLNIKTANVAQVLITLHAIMQIPGDDRTPVTLWHTSLRDFLCSKDRAQQFHATHRSLVYACTLSICRFDSSSPPASEDTRRFALFHWEQFLNTENDSKTADSQTLKALAEFLNHPFEGNSTPLEAAVRSRNWTVVRALVEVTDDINIQFRGESAAQPLVKQEPNLISL